MKLGSISEIHRYPVKSMQGERLTEVEVRGDGLRGDRAWAIRDEVRGGIEGARKLPSLLGCTARYATTQASDEPLSVPEVTLPDGDRFSVADAALVARVGELCGREVSLWPRRPASDDAHYRRGAPDHEDMLEELRAIFGRLPEEPLPDIGTFPPEVLTASTLPGTYFDCYPIFLLSRASLESLTAAAPGSRFDARRFRPNLLIETGEAGGFPENAWVGHRISVGEVVLEVAMECPRCVMTTHGFDDLPQDPAIMRTLVKENGGNLGIYASVAQAGVVREGDEITRLD